MLIYYAEKQNLVAKECLHMDLFQITIQLILQITG